MGTRSGAAAASMARSADATGADGLDVVEIGLVGDVVATLHGTWLLISVVNGGPGIAPG
jgi:hypothetical protein